MSRADQSNLAAPAAAFPPPAPPPAPREVTPAASRRAWQEPRVHFWWIVALALLAVAAWMAVQQAIAWNADARLVRSGTRVDAVIWLTGHARVKGRPIDEGEYVNVEFAWNGEERVVGMRRFAGREAETHTGETIQLFVDPQNPDRYTARARPPPLSRSLMGAFSLVCVAVLLLLVSALKRRGVLATWRTGEARQAAVVETRQTALAPRSRLVRCALAGGGDRRLINVYVPHRAANLQSGDGLWLVMPPGRPDKAVAAMLYG